MFDAAKMQRPHSDNVFPFIFTTNLPAFRRHVEFLFNGHHYYRDSLEIKQMRASNENVQNLNPSWQILIRLKGAALHFNTIR